MGSKTKTKTDVAPPSWALGTIKGALGSETDAFNSANDTLKQYAPYQKDAIDFAHNNMTNPSAFTTDAQGLLDNTINGQYLTPGTNPYEAGMAKQIADQTGGQYASTFGASGRAHGGLAALLSSQGVGNALDNFYGNIYEQERSRQQQAMMAAPAFHADQFTAANEMFPQINATAMGPLQAAALYGNSVAGTVGPYGTTTTTQKTPFGLQQAIGLGMMGASMIPGVGNILGLGGAGAYGASPFGMAGLMAPTASGIPIGASPTGNMIFGSGTGWGG